MISDKTIQDLRFYYITDDSCSCKVNPVNQVKIAIMAGATMIQYRNKSFTSRFFEEVTAIKNLCQSNLIPFIVNDNILLAKAVSADGVHLGQEDENPVIARKILGSEAIVGISVSNPSELKKTDLSCCDYIGTGPVFPTQTKKDAKQVCGLLGLEAVAKESPIPVVAIGGINSKNATACFAHGAAGIAVISFISRAKKPEKNARQLGLTCGLTAKKCLDLPWKDEFALIQKLLKFAPCEARTGPYIKVPPGDDACLLCSIKHPVVTTDTHTQGVHFRLDWQTPYEIGNKAVAITLSDLAASYAIPACLFINLGLPSNFSDKTVEALYKGIKNGLLKYRCSLGGGNISRAAQLSLDLFAIGCGRDDIFPVRSGALPGEGVYCTGPLGLARAGLELLKKKDFSFQELIAKFIFPAAKFEAAQILAENKVRCVLDISDGLAGDAEHIAEASGITIKFNLMAFIIDPVLALYCSKYNKKPEEIILSGGEDYELLFTCSSDKFKKIKKKLPDSFQVGECLPFTGKHLIDLPNKILSFQHGKI